MKLHLPSALRKALMACLAALSLPVILPTTLGTASGIATAAWLALSQRVAAEDVRITSKRDDNSYNSALESKNGPGNTWIFEVPDDIDFNFGVDGNHSPTHEANFQFNRQLTINNGFTGSTNTFNGAFTGTGDMYFVSWGNQAVNNWVFNGDLSQYQGSIRSSTKEGVSAGVLNIEFNEGARSNTGAIRQEGSSTINLTLHGQGMDNREISVNELTVYKGASFRAGSNVTAAGNLVVHSEPNEETVVGVGDGGTLKAEIVELIGGDVTVELGTGAKLDWVNLRANSNTLTIQLSAGEVISDADVGLYGSDRYGYELFGSRWRGGNAHIRIEATSVSGRKLTLADTGKLIYDSACPSLTWTSSPTNGVLEWIGRRAWDDGETFGDEPNPDVYLEGIGGTVNIGAGRLEVVHANFDGHGEFDLEYTGKESEGTLNVGGIIFVGNDSVVRVGQDITVSVGRYTGEGVFSLNGGTLEIREDENPVIETLEVTEQGGTLKPLGGEETSVTLNNLNSPEGELRVEGYGGKATVKLPNGGTLKSLIQEGVPAVDIGLSGRLTLNAGGLAYGLFTFEQNESELVVGGDFTAGGGFTHIVPEDLDVWNADGTASLGAELGTLTYKILSSAKTGPVTVTIGERQLDNETVSGNLTIGDENHRVDVVKTGSRIQSFGEGTVEIWGDVKVESGGTLCIKDTRVWRERVEGEEGEGGEGGEGGGAEGTIITKEAIQRQPELAGRRNITNSDIYEEYKVEIHGTLDGDGGLYISDSTVTLRGASNHIGVLRFSNQDKGNVLELEGDLTVGEIGYCGYDDPANTPTDGAGTIRRAEGVPTSKMLYVLLNPIDAGLMTVDEFLDRYHPADVTPPDDETTEEPTDEPPHVGVRLGEMIGIGKGGEGELRLRAESESEAITAPFKLTGSGTLLWAEGTQEIEHFTGEVEEVESTDEANPRIEIVGPTLKLTGGTLILGEVSGTVKTVDLDAREVGRLTLALKGGTLRGYTLTGAPGAAIELRLTPVDNIGGWLDFETIEAADGPFSIRLTGEKLTSIQLFAPISEFWNGHLKEQLLGEGGTGYAWTDLFRIEMDRAMLDAWEVQDVNELTFRITDEGVLKIEKLEYLLWTGSEEDVWSSTHTEGWGNDMNSPEGKNLRFTKDSGSSIVNVGGYRPVAPKNVEIESGNFIFQREPGSEEMGGLKMSSDEDGNGVLHIAEDAVLHLNLRNTSIPVVHLEGTLGLGDPEALPEGTHLQFNGGMLLYDTDGAVQDVSMLVDGDSSGIIRVAVDETVTGGATWGRNDTAIGDNPGLNMALNGKGLEKSDGYGNFTLAWQDDGTEEHKAHLAVEVGTLTLDVGTVPPDTAPPDADTVPPNAGGADADVFAVLGGDVTGAGTLVVGGSSKVILSGNNTVKGIELDADTITYIKGTTALGGAETVLTLAGGTLTGDNGAEAQAGAVNVTADTTVGVVTLAGAVTGSGALIVEDGTSAGLSGDLTKYKGELKTGKSGTWRLSGGALATFTNEKAVVSGSGTVQFDGTGTFGGKLGGNVTLRGNNGELTVVTQEETGAVGVTLAGTVVLGDANTQAKWYDTALADNSSIYLGNVDLHAVFAKGEGTKLYVRTATAKTRPENDITVNVNGMDAKELDGITINGHGQLTGITGTYTVDGEHGLELHFARENVEEEVATEGEPSPAPDLAEDEKPRALIGGGEGGFTLKSEGDGGRRIWLDSDAVSEILAIMSKAKEPDQEATARLHLLDQGTLRMSELSLGDLLGDEVQILRSLDAVLTVDEGNGDLVLRGSASDVFVALAGKTVLQSGSFLGDAKATVLSDATTDFTVRIDGANEPNVTVHNLLGLTGSMLHLENSNAADPTGENRLDVAFDNTKVEDIREPGKYPTVDGTDVHGQHTSYKGSIDAGSGVDVTKTGYGTLTVGGSYTLADGTTTIVQGALRLRGTDNAMEGLTFAYDAETQQTGQGEEDRGLILEGGTTTVRGAVSDGSVEGVTGQGDIELNNAELILNGQSELRGTTITSSGGTGKLTLKKAEAAQGEAAERAETPAPSLVLSGERVKTVLSGVDAEVQAGTLKLQNGATMVNSSVALGAAGTLDLGNSANHTLRRLSGGGTLSATGGRATLAEASAFSGTLNGAGTLAVLAGAELQLDNVTTVPAAQAAGWGITVEGTGQDGKKEGGKLVIDVSKKAVGEQLTLGAVNLGSGSTTTIKVNADTYNAEGVSTITGTSLSFADNTNVVLSVVGEKAWDYSRELTIGTYGSVHGNMEELRKGIKLEGAGFLLSDVENVEVDENGKVVVSFQKSSGKKLLGAMPNGAKNAQAGAKMVEGSLASKTMTPGTDYAGVVDYVVAMYDNGVLPSIQGQLSAVAGASVAVLGPALSEDMHRQLGSIRNRTTTMANEVTQETYGQLPLWHAWINAEGSYHKMDEDSIAPGYTLNSWGGTVGADVDLSPHVTVGLAVTAMYGDLDADSADTATGDLDTSYLSAFVRATHGAWIHTVVVSGGVANVKLNRTVNYGVSSYAAHGDTDGYAFGAMYEVGYTGLVNKRGTAALQPVFNVEVRQVAISGYTETGSDAGVDVDDIDQSVVTFGAGVRAQAAVGTNAFNRTSVLESRLLLKLDVGDRSGTASNAIVGGKTRAEVESAEVGEVGVEFGAGISVPLGADLGSVFLDGSVEYREGWTSANATLGYRVTF